MFTFTCGLKQITSQAYVHVEEENNAENVAFMGLNLSKYIQDPALLRQRTWEGTSAFAAVWAACCGSKELVAGIHFATRIVQLTNQHV